MKKSPSKKKNVPAKRNFWSFNKQNRSERLAAVALVLIVVIVVGVGAWLLSRHVAMNHEKHDFATAQADTRTIASAIEAAVGKPSDSLTYGECSRPNSVFNNGPLGCLVGTAVVYGVSSDTQAQSIAAASDSVLKKTSPAKVLGHPNPMIKFNTHVTNVSDNEYSTSYLDSSAEKLTCGISYSFYTDQKNIHATYHARSLKSDGPYTLLIDLSCSHSAMAYYYSYVR